MVHVSGHTDYEVLGKVIGLEEISDVLLVDGSKIFPDSVDWLSDVVVSEGLLVA